VDDSKLWSKCGWSPFAGEKFSHQIERTIVSGKIAYEKGEVNTDCRGEAVEFARERR